MKYNDNGEYKDIYVKAFDTLPIGTEVDYDGSVVPSGWTEVNNIIWTNPNPSNAISTSQITVADMNKYDVIEIWFRQYRTTSNQHYQARFIKGDNMQITWNGLGTYQGSNYYITRSRVISYIDNTTLAIDYGWQNNNGTITQDDNVAIPEYIVGYNTGLFN